MMHAIIYQKETDDKMDWIKIAKEIGFEDACPLKMDSLRVLPEVREMCRADRCHIYGTRWACPPGCGTVEVCRRRMADYQSGILVQTVGTLADEFDAEGIARAHRTHQARFRLLARQVRHILPDCLPLSAGSCELCEVCTYPKKPCRFPGKMLSSMEAYGLLVSEVCVQSGMPYYRGEKTITFTSCILLEKNEKPHNKEEL